MMAKETKNGWVFPDGVPVPPDHAWHRFKIGGTEIYGFDWNHHIELARDAGLESVDAEIQTAGSSNDVFYAGVRVEVTVDGETYACVHGADEASNQVREPDYVFAVAESRATKRAVKKALGIVPADEETSQGSDSTLENEPPGSVAHEPDVNVEDTGW